MIKDRYFWLGIIANTIWIVLGLVCILAAVGILSELVTWWLFGIGLIAGGLMGVTAMFRSEAADLL